MQRPSNPQKLEFWRNHLAAIKKYQGSMKAYCREHELDYHNLKYWQQRIKTEGASRPLAQKKSSFLPVVIAEAAVASPAKHKILPDAKWLAEVLFEIQARCS